MTRPRVIVIACPNGAGKTTFARAFLPEEAQLPRFINADLIAAGLSPFAPEAAAIKAGRLMLEEIAACSERRESFAFETTLSGLSYLRLRQRRQGAGSHRLGRSTVKQDQLSQAKDKDLPASLTALRRAARHARELAMKTGTAIVVQRGQEAVRITAEELRHAEAARAAEDQGGE